MNKKEHLKELTSFIVFSRELRTLNDEELFNLFGIIINEIKIRQHDKLLIKGLEE